MATKRRLLEHGGRRWRRQARLAARLICDSGC